MRFSSYKNHTCVTIIKPSALIAEHRWECKIEEGASGKYVLQNEEMSRGGISKVVNNSLRGLSTRFCIPTHLQDRNAIHSLRHQSQSVIRGVLPFREGFNPLSHHPSLHRNAVWFFVNIFNFR